MDLSDARKQIISEWQRMFPEAAAEVSADLRPLVKIGERNGSEYWNSDRYAVVLERMEDTVFKSGGDMVRLDTTRLDGTAVFDFRDLQAVKNQLCGAETEAIMLLPAESRLIDNANLTVVFAFPGLKRIKCGANRRDVCDADTSGLPQRAFPKS